MNNELDPKLKLQAILDADPVSLENSSDLDALLKDHSLAQDKREIDFVKQWVDLAGDDPTNCPQPSGEFFQTIFKRIQSEMDLESLSDQDILNIQAFSDGQLDGAQSREVSDIIFSNPDARTLFVSLRSQKNLIRGLGEPHTECPENADFYWSQIERELEPHSEPSQAQEIPVGGFSQFKKWIMNPLAIPAMLVFILCLFVGNQFHSASIFEEVQVSSAFIDDQYQIAVYYVDDPDFLKVSGP